MNLDVMYDGYAVGGDGSEAMLRQSVARIVEAQFARFRQQPGLAAPAELSWLSPEDAVMASRRRLPDKHLPPDAPLDEFWTEIRFRRAETKLLCAVATLSRPGRLCGDPSADALFEDLRAEVRAAWLRPDALAHDLPNL